MDFKILITKKTAGTFIYILKLTQKSLGTVLKFTLVKIKKKNCPHYTFVTMIKKL